MRASALRVASIGASIEWWGFGVRAAAKEWAGWAAPFVGSLQVVAL